MKYIVVGLGVYGRVLVSELTELGHEVIGVDVSENYTDHVKDKCSAVFQLDATDEMALSILPIKDVDIIIVAIGENLGASVRAVALLKKLGAKHIYARAGDRIHLDILQAFNVDKIIIPEEDAAVMLVHQMDLGSQVDVFRVDADYCIFKFGIPKEFIGYSLHEITILGKYNLKVISVVKDRGMAHNCLGIEYRNKTVMCDAEYRSPLVEGDTIFCYGKEKDFRKLLRFLK